MVEITVLACDVDQRPGPTVRRYTVTVSGESATLDLCDHHAGPFAEVGKQVASRSEPKKRARSSSSGRRPVTTLDEIEAMKASAADSKP